jgi:Phage integrase, N-terminal SAM-like domain
MSTVTISPLRQRMIEDMTARKLCAGTQKGHIQSCKRFAAFLKRSPDTATAEDIRQFQLHLSETGVSICNRNRIMTGVRGRDRLPAFTKRPYSGQCRCNAWPDRELDCKHVTGCNVDAGSPEKPQSGRDHGRKSLRRY